MEKLYIYVNKRNGDYQFVSSALSAKRIKREGVEDATYYEFDLKKLTPVKIDLIVSNT